MNREKVDQLRNGRLAVDGDNWAVLNLSPTGRTIRLSYSGDLESGAKGTDGVTPRFEIEFDDTIKLECIVPELQKVLSFLSFTLRVRISPEDVRLSRNSQKELFESIEQGEALADHRLLSLWRHDEISDSDSTFDPPPIRASNGEELEALGRCLETWIDRSDQWRDAYFLMLDCFSKRREVTGARLLSACKWLEKTPTAKVSSILNANDLSDIVDAAFRAAEGLGVDISKQRISGALQAISTESRKQSSERLIQTAWEGYRPPRLKEDFAKNIKDAYTYRGRAAHGVLDIADQQTFEKLAISIAAVEALCFMLMAKELPLSPLGRGALQGHRAVTDYREYARLSMQEANM